MKKLGLSDPSPTSAKLLNVKKDTEIENDLILNLLLLKISALSYGDTKKDPLLQPAKLILDKDYFLPLLLELQDFYLC
jgi:hypothetical protein